MARQFQDRIGTGRIVALGAVALMSTTAIAIAAWADIARGGRFPHAPAALARACCGSPPTLVGLTPSQQLAHVPLAAFPLFDAGRAAAKAGDMARARRLMETAVGRDPQLIPARAWLADDAIARGRPADAVRQIDWIYSLSNPLRGSLATILAGIATRPGGVKALQPYMARAPIWQQALTNELAKSNADPRIVYALVAPSANGPANVAAKLAQQQALVGGMVAKGDYEGAYLAWVAQLPSDAMKDVGYVYDSNFRGLPGIPPFNWRLTDSEAASTDLIPGGGVRVSYYGEAPIRPIEQTVMLQPGRYTLVVVGNSLGDVDANQLAATISCATQPLATVQIRSSPSLVRMGSAFTVPDGCKAQVIAFVGTAGEYTKAAEFTIKSLSIVKEGGQ